MFCSRAVVAIVVFVCLVYSAQLLWWLLLLMCIGKPQNAKNLLVSDCVSFIFVVVLLWVILLFLQRFCYMLMLPALIISFDPQGRLLKFSPLLEEKRVGQTPQSTHNHVEIDNVRFSFCCPAIVVPLEFIRDCLMVPVGGFEHSEFESNTAFTRQTDVGQLVLANSNWCVWTT